MVDYYSQSGCSDYFSECVFGAKLGFFGAWGNYYFCKGFVMINPDKPLEFVEALREIDPNLSVEGFEQIKTN